MAYRWARAASAAVALAALSAAGGCLPTELNNEALWTVVGGAETNTIAVGDTVTLRAEAVRCFYAGCPGVSSTGAPERFRWASHTAGVAEIEPGGFLRALAVGEARLRVTFLSTAGDRTADVTMQVVAARQ